MRLDTLLTCWRPGSFDPPWTWDDEDEDLFLSESFCRSIAIMGVLRPVVLGHDGRVWDGHHRIIAARRLGLTDLPVVYAPVEQLTLF